MKKKIVVLIVVVLAGLACTFGIKSLMHRHRSRMLAAESLATKSSVKNGDSQDSQLSPADQQAHKAYSHAEKLAATGHLDDSIKILDSIAKDNKGSWYEVFSQYQKANWLLYGDRKSEARDVFLQVQKKYPESYLSIRAAAQIEKMDLKEKRLQAAITTKDLKPLPLTGPNADDNKISADCGPECLLEACKLFGIKATKAELKSMTKTNEKGTTMLNLAKAARSKGMSATGQMVNYQYLQEMEKPVIAWVNRNHYVLVKEVGGASLTVYDPNDGERIVARTQFCGEWQGYILTLKFADSAKKSVKTSSSRIGLSLQKQPV